MTIKAILFDKDGTLLDFHRTWLPVNWDVALHLAEGDRQLAERLLVAAGYDPESGRIRSGSPLAAGNTVEIAGYFARHLPHRDLVEMVGEVDAIYVEGGRRCAVAVPLLEETLAALRARNLVLGVATSDSEEGAEASLRAVGVREHFVFLAGYDSGYGHKPAPGMVHAFCDAVSLRPGDIAVVGDNLHDLEMGRAAGARLVVGVLTGNSQRDELLSHADDVLDSIAALETLLDEVS